MPEATEGTAGTRPLADTDPLKNVSFIQQKSTLVTVGVGALALLALIAATALLLMR